MRGMAPVLLFLAACAPRAVPPRPSVPFDAAPRALAGDVRVAPIVVDAQAPGFDGRTFVGDLSAPRALVRLDRTRQVGDVPRALGLAVPGAMVEALGDRWAARLSPATLGSAGRDRIVAALHGRADLDATLGDLASDLGGDAALFVWIDRLEGRPVSAEGFPGDLIATDAGPVVIDHRDEPYRVVARAGVALVAADGEVVLRYADTFEAVLNGRSDADQTARDLARALAAEVTALWPSDPRLGAR